MESNDLRALSELYLKTVYEDKKYGYDKDGNSLNPVDIEKRKKEDDDLAGSPNEKNGKKNGKKAKRWWDDDGDGKGYEKGEVDGKFPDKDGSKKKKVKEEVEIDEGIVRTIKKVKRIAKRVRDSFDDDPGRAHTIGTLGNPNARNEDKRAAERKAGKKKVKEEVEIDEAVYGGKKEAPKDNRMVLTHADKKANTPAWQNRDKKNPKTGEPIYKKADHLKNEEVEVDESIGSAIDKTLGAAGEVADTAIKLPAKGIGYLKGLKKGIKKAAKKGEDKAAGDAGPKNEELDPGMEHNLSVLKMLAEKEVNVKDTKKVVDAIRAYDKSKDASRDATDDSDKGDKEGAAIEKKYAAKERGEIDKDDPNWKKKKYHTGMHGESMQHRRNPEGSIKDRFKSRQTDPSKDNFTGIGDDIGEIMRQNAAMKKAAAAKKTKKEELELTGKFTAEEIEGILEAERDLGDRLHRKRKLYDRTVKKAMDYARREGEAAGHSRYRMGQLDTEMDKVKDKMKKEK